MERLDVAGFDEVYRVDCAGSPAFVALHAVLRGRAFGGIRVRRYDGEGDALADALALARAMSRKVVLAGIPGGGAKAVLVEPEPAARPAALRALGAFIASLGGRYFAGPDYGFTPDDAAHLGDGARWFAAGDLGPATAEGVLAAMDAAVRFCASGAAPAAMSVVAIQGLGSVGGALAALLRGRGVRVVASDPRGVPPGAGIEEVPADALYDVPCDVFAPCAVGGVLDARAVARLRCAVVCGAANNPLASDDEADRLRARGVAYVPDFIANAGALIHGASRTLGEEARIPDRMRAVGELTSEVLERAAGEGRSTHAVAVSMADAQIARLREAATATW